MIARHQLSERVLGFLYKRRLRRTSFRIRGLIRHSLIDQTQLEWVWVRRFGIGHGEALISGAVRGHFEDAPRGAGWRCSLAGARWGRGSRVAPSSGQSCPARTEVSPRFSGLWDLL